MLARAMLVGCVLILLAAGAAAAPDKGKNVYQTKTAYIAAYHMLQCNAQTMLTPSNTAEVAAIVKQYYQKAQAGTPVTLRVSRPKFHSTATFVCPVVPGAFPPGGPAGSTPPAKSSKPNSPAGTVQESAQRVPAAAAAIGLLQSKLNKVLAVDKNKFTMRVGAGMRVTELLPAATKAGMSMQIGTLPAYAGLTLGGILSTSSHGSGDRTASSLGDTVLEVTWVDGTGKVHVAKRSDPELKAFHGGLGVFGVVTELLLQMTPPTNTQLITVLREDIDLMAEIDKLLKITPHILIHWRPDSGMFKAFLIKTAPAGAKAASGVNMTVLPNIGDQSAMAAMFNVWHTTTGDDSDMMEFLCPQVTDGSTQAAWASVDGERKMNVTGPTNNMMASECDEHCTWNDRNVFNGTAQDSEFTMEFTRLAEWISDVKRVFNVELKESGKASYRCMGLGYMWIRFGQNYDGVTATNSGMQRPVYVQSTWLRSRAGSLFPMRYQFVVDLIEELTLCKYRARPHWGKNFDRTFMHPKCPVVPLYPNFNTLVSLAQKHDPQGMFRPRLFDKMVKQQGFELSPRCSALNKCYCQQDIHCAKGLRCVPSLAFPKYKVCKAPTKNVKNSILPKMLEAAFAA